MTNIVTLFQPFSLNQKVLVYSDGNVLEDISVPIDNITDVIAGLRNQYNVKCIDLVGSKDYLAQFKAQLGSKFQEDETEINIISR